MTGKEYDPNSDQPNNPNFADWYASLLCPWHLEKCGNEPLGMHGPESKGVSALAAPKDKMNAQYFPKPKDDYVQDEPLRRTMSCGLCGHLERKLGKPPFKLDPPTVSSVVGPISQRTYKEADALYTANWDFHPFGAWLANYLDKKIGTPSVVKHINNWKTSNGEEMHGYLWQSTRLLAYDTKSLDGNRLESPDPKVAEKHVMEVCESTWWLAPQSRDDCAHAAGHGFFYFHLDIGKAVQSCWSDLIVDHTHSRGKIPDI